MNPNEKQDDGIYGQLVKHGLIGIATNALPGMAIGGDGAALLDSTSPAIDAAGSSSLAMADGGTLIHGPAEGGAFLDRPVGGYLAAEASGNSVDLELSQNGISEIARGIDEGSTLTIDGHQIAVLDYVPGGDLVQAAGGQALEPAQALMMLIQARHFSAAAGGASPNGEIAAEVAANGISPAGAGIAAADGNTVLTAGAAGSAALARTDGPDQDEHARDMAILMEEHARDVAVQVESFDQASVHTEIHAHGRTLSVDTEFEARHPDVEHEKEVADHHVDEIVTAPNPEKVTQTQAMRFYSMVQSQADEGLEP